MRQVVDLRAGEGLPVDATDTHGYYLRVQELGRAGLQNQLASTLEEGSQECKELKACEKACQGHLALQALMVDNY